MMKKKKIFLSLLCGLTVHAVSAQGVSYDHDASKMNQITVQEVGTGSLTPEIYYWMFHNSYRKSAAKKNKLTYRSTAGMACYQQVDDAEKLDSALVKRAEIEALNVADRTGGALDLAWGVEGDKITSKLETFENNIRRILQAGGTAVEQRYWQEQAAVFKSAIKATQDAYMPNAQRKQQYLAIYDDITKQNETLISFLIQLSNKRKTSSLLAARLERRNNVASHASSAISRWREAGKKNIGNNSGGSETDDSDDNNIVRQ